MSEQLSPSAAFARLFSGFCHMRLPRRVCMTAWMPHVPFAFWLVEAAAPRQLVELGTHNGVSFGAFCQQVEQSGHNTMCYAVDTWTGDEQAGFYDEDIHAKLNEHVHAHYGAFAHLIRSTFDDALPLFTDGSVDVLHIDGCHSYDAMMHDFEVWLPKMSSRGIVLMHDINAHIEGYGGLRAWEDISGRFPSFAFTHGYGLGIALTGGDPPEKLLQLTKEGQCPAFTEYVRHYFMLQGGALQKNLDAVLRMEGERHVANELRTFLQNERHLVHHLEVRLEDEIRAHAGARDLAEAVRQRYECSHSWRITRPLRALGAWLRRRSRPGTDKEEA